MKLKRELPDVSYCFLIQKSFMQKRNVDLTKTVGLPHPATNQKLQQTKSLALAHLVINGDAG